MRKSYYWKLKRRELSFGTRTLIMGVLNVTPDSFSDGGKFSDPDRAFAHAVAMEEQGADMIDIGAESTRPDSKPVSAEEELRRLVPVLKRLRDHLSIPISIDTYKAEVAERAIELGAEIINDPTGLTYDPQLCYVVKEHDAGLIINHMRGRPETWAKLPPLPDVMLSITKDLDASVNRARRNGVDRGRMMVDPGIGFGKRKEQNAEILARLREMEALDLPILVGPSRKSFLAQEKPEDTRLATAAAVTAAILNGAHMVRVHDVAEMRMVAMLCDEVLKAARLDEPEEKPRTRTIRARPDTESQMERPKLLPPMKMREVPVAEPVAPEDAVETGEDATEAAPERPAYRKPAEETERRPYRPAASGPSDRKPPYRRASEGEERRPYRPAASGGAGDRRPPYRKAGEGTGERRPPFRKTSDGPSDRRPPYRSAGEGSGDRRPPFRKAGESSGERRPPYRSGGEGAGERRPPFRKAGESSGERRPPFRSAGEGAGERRPPFRKAGESSGERRPPFRSGGEGAGERRPPFRKAAGEGGERRPPYRKDSAGFGDRKPPFRKSGPPSGDRPYRPASDAASGERRPPFKSSGKPPFKSGGRPPFKSEGRPPFRKSSGPPGSRPPSRGTRPPSSRPPGKRPPRS